MPRVRRGVASCNRQACAGKAEPYRTVRRQSREAFGFAMLVFSYRLQFGHSLMQRSTLEAYSPRVESRDIHRRFQLSKEPRQILLLVIRIQAAGIG